MSSAAPLREQLYAYAQLYSYRSAYRKYKGRCALKRLRAGIIVNKRPRCTVTMPHLDHTATLRDTPFQRVSYVRERVQHSAAACKIGTTLNVTTPYLYVVGLLGKVWTLDGDVADSKRGFMLDGCEWSERKRERC